MITCPSEITAISMADGYARVTGRPQAVLVHVDVGTQALGKGIHNASVGRVPVLIFAGLCPYTESGELPGSRTEYMHWLQEAPDQKAIVRQYCRYTGEVRTGLNVKQTIGRALQFANSAPKGPTYVASAREVLAQEIQPYALEQDQWVSIGPSALPAEAVHDISAALVQAERPLIITGYSGRDRRTPDLLVALADNIPGIRVHDTGGSDMCFPFSHIASEGFRLSLDDCTKDADVIFLLDCDVPWIPSRNPPPKHAKIYHVDSDPLNQQIPVSFFPAHGRWKADSFTALTQLVNHIKHDVSLTTSLQDPKYNERLEARADAHRARLANIARQPRLDDQERLDAHNIGAILKTSLPDSTSYVVEAVTASQVLHDQLQPSRPGSWINCGGTGIGWSNGAAPGVKMALTELEKDGERGSSLVCQLVGDGSFMCAAPSSALWVASKYEIPVLTIVLNNGGATGLVGSAVLDAMLKMKDVTKISIISRRPVKMAEDAKDPRVTTIIHNNFEKYDSDLLSKVEGAAGCVWALGISQTQVGKEEYIQITKTMTLRAAEAFQTLATPAQPFNFVYVSGEGTTHTPGRFTPIFGRVKGETEVALSEMHNANSNFHASSVRPAFVDSAQHDAINEYVPTQNMMIQATSMVLGGPIRCFAKGSWSPTEALGRFMTEMAMGKWDGQLEGPGIEKLGDFPIVRNFGFRRLAGLDKN
ncbi:Benzoylformate decarboxylase [Cytospora mali]|uniref:Benzoylformate decarboxylase n=1 Tax=Cytospora mali TaxID=578113 RepID=A0A194UTT9_CYTMA|nr:Benzoylformate decarboxylase [Valsa mali var. pyri (nom. inval.)]